MKTTLKHIVLSLIPSLVLGFGFFFLISLLNGMNEIDNTSLIWFPISGKAILDIIGGALNSGFSESRICG